MLEEHSRNSGDEVSEKTAVRTGRQSRSTVDRRQSSRGLDARTCKPGEYRIYVEGWESGRAQVDPDVDMLDATVDVLNPYSDAEERERWAVGFKDAVHHAKKYSKSKQIADVAK